MLFRKHRGRDARVLYNAVIVTKEVSWPIDRNSKHLRLDSQCGRKVSCDSLLPSQHQRWLILLCFAFCCTVRWASCLQRQRCLYHYITCMVCVQEGSNSHWLSQGRWHPSRIFLNHLPVKFLPISVFIKWVHNRLRVFYLGWRHRKASIWPYG